MSESFTDQSAAAANPGVFDPSIFEQCTANTAVLTVLHPVTKAPTPWKITFAGPGHPQHDALNEKLARKALRKRARQEAARVNRAKWKPEEQEPDEARRENAEIIADQIVTWEGASIPFSRDAAVAMLMNPGYVFLTRQIDDFLEGEDVFIKGSATS